MGDELRRAFGDIAEEITDRTDVIAARWPLAAYTTTEGSVYVHNLIGPDYCTPQRLLDLAGYGTTQDDGNVDLTPQRFPLPRQATCCGRELSRI